ncbi:peptide-methionine (S)-S-oxide reductase [Caulobacter sp. CCUG 60055]|uniref:peptide-methionine (S)-S-oxide reductase MsrA n=1 Tax=Caulobacter sp. CCUG 60055 TaxID=2100090 RepID=UPI001FA782A9|nr:peptide-methionine (S)-S-oxide reductase MsrA [Caulobacter sp. CCUG 60055]MCI3182179.1 peptide-methionine (S)-S-oxide reductase [Caulobacter sp. CCUG 60055]
MRRWLLTALTALLALPFLATPLLAASPAKPKTEQAVFAGGCFWCMESDMKAIPGVISVESGYTGGAMARPGYRDVLTEKTGHYEAVRVTFDAGKIDYGYLLSRYWRLVDPTDDGGQFCDRGPSYRTAVFVDGAEQKRLAEASRAEAAKRLKTGRMLTPVLALGPFWPAEAYHRDYAKRHPEDYHAYRLGCGRDARLAAVWGKN